MYLYYGFDTEARTKVHVSSLIKNPQNHRPVDKIRSNYIKRVFDDFEKLSKEEFAVKYKFNEPPPNLETREQTMEPFPFLELPPELQVDILTRAPLETVFTAQFVCKTLRNYSLHDPKVNTSIPILGKYLGSTYNAVVSIKARPTVFHFCLENKLVYSSPVTASDEFVYGNFVRRSFENQTEYFYNSLKEKITWESDTLMDRLIRHIESCVRDNTIKIYSLVKQTSPTHEELSWFTEHSEHFGVAIQLRPKTKEEASLSIVDYALNLLQFLHKNRCN